MLIQFKSEVGGLVMFGDVAVKLLRMCGHSGTVPGAIPANEMAQALARLEEQLSALMASGEEQGAGDKSGNGAKDAEDEDGKAPVSLTQRAFPLIELMRRAAAEPCAIQWRED